MRTSCPPPSPYEPSISSTGGPRLKEASHDLRHFDEQERGESDRERLDPVERVEGPCVEHGLQERQLDHRNLQSRGGCDGEEELLVCQHPDLPESLPRGADAEHEEQFEEHDCGEGDTARSQDAIRSRIPRMLP